MRWFMALFSGALFGAGLALSGMMDPARVRGFLDIFGDWDPTLAFVMGGAMIPMAIAWLVARKRQSSVLGVPLPPPPSREIDRKLIIGSVLFGIGWGLAGLCPGPSIAALSFGGSGLYVFVAAMLTGMVVAPFVRSRLDKAVPAE